MKPIDCPDAESTRTDLQGLLDELQTTPLPRPPRTAILLGTVEDTHNPDLPGRVFVRWSSARRTVQQAWLRYACGSAPRPGETVVLVRPDNDPAWLVTAVLGRESVGPSNAAEGSEAVRLQPGQRLQVQSHDGTGLVELDGRDGEVTVRLLARDVTLRAEGELRLAGESVAVRGGAQGVDIRTDRDVVVRGRFVRIN